MADKANEATSRCQAPASPASATSSAFLPGQRDLDAPGQNLANSGDADDGDLPQTFNHLSIDEPIAMGKSGSTVLGVKPSTTSDMSGKPVRLPPELCLKMIKHLDAKSLKNARLVSKAWKDFSTPHLFRNVVFSPEPLNVKSLRNLVKNPELAKHVENLHLDCTSGVSYATPEAYAKMASLYFSQVFALGEQDTGPFCENNLLEVLQTSSSRPLNHKYLTGKPRGHFIAGFTLYSARVTYAMRMFQADEAYKHLNFVISKLKNLKHMEATSYWTTTDEPYQQDFQRYLAANLPQKSLDLISDFKQPAIQDRVTATTSAFCAPGAAARDLHPMIIAPCFSACAGTVHLHEMINPALRALRDNQVKLASLSLPGGDELGSLRDVESAQGMVPFPSLLEGVKNDLKPLSTSKTLNVLLPLFRHIKVLELNIDFLRPGNDMRRMRDRLPPERFCKAVQQMKALESLSLGAVKYSRGHLAVPDLSNLLLYKEEDYAKPDDSSNPDGGDDDGPPPDMNQMLNMLFGPMMGGAPTTGNAPLTTPAPAAGTGASVPSSQPPNPTAGQAALAPGLVPMGGSFTIGATSVDANGNTTTHALPPINVNSLLNPPHASSARAAPDTPLDPIPWPNLKYISLWNLPASPAEIARLVKTVKGTLRTLKLDNIHFEYHDTEHLEPPAHGPHVSPNTHGDMELSDEEVESDDADSIDLPDRVSWSHMSGGGPSMANTSNTSPSAANTSTSVPPQAATSHLQPASFIPPQPASSNGPSATNTTNTLPLFPGAAALFGLGTAGPAMGQPQTNGSTSATAFGKKDVAEQWLSTIELFSDELRLEQCTITLHCSEMRSLKERLGGDLSGLSMLPSLGSEIGNYVVEGGGMGFVLHLSNKIEELDEKMQQKVEKEMKRMGARANFAKEVDSDESTEDEYSDDESSEDDWEDDDSALVEDAERRKRVDAILAKMGTNLHIYSAWQACP